MSEMKANFSIVFYFTHSDSWLGKLIRFCSHGYWNHVAVSVHYPNQPGEVIEADWGGVIKTPLAKWKKKNLQNPANVFGFSCCFTPTQTEKFAEALQRKVGKSYDYMALLGFLLRLRRANREDKYFCSELVATCLRETGIQIYPEWNEWRITPSELFYALTAYQKGIEHFANTTYIPE